MLLSLMIYGCATPHGNYIRTINLLVGKRIDQPLIIISDGELISRVENADGNIVYSYLYPAPCISIFEVDPVTNVIVRASFKGSESTCFLVP